MEPRSNRLFFDPDQHPEDTLKSFEQFIQSFELRYYAQYPDPPKVSLEAAIERWKITHTVKGSTEQPRPTLEQYDEICEDWQSKDKVAKFLSLFQQVNYTQTGV